MGERRFTVTTSQVLSLQTFFARQAMISNLLPSWLFVRIGGSDIPSAASSDWAVPPMTAQIIPLPATNIISIGVGPALVTLGQQVMAGQGAIVTLYDEPTPVAVGSMDLNPSRMGQMTQETFTVASAYTIAFPVTTIHVANYSPRWLYVGIDTLVLPTAATCQIAIPPMSEKALPCAPTALFSFSFDAVTVTVGNQVPITIRVIATFYEYPTPVSVGTANLYPSHLGQSVQEIFIADAMYGLPFRATQIHVSNYSNSWVYVAYGTIIIPTAANAMAAVPPMTERSLPCPPNLQFAFAVVAPTLTVGDQVPAGLRIVATFYEYPTPVSIGTANLNPSRMGQSTQRIFTIAGSYTLAFQATQIHVSNYSNSWVYLAYGTLVIPTAANAMASVPPLSERSLSCPPNTQFAFGLSAATVMVGTDVPQTNIVATFYEYPVPVTLGAANLSPGGFRYREALHFPAAVVPHNTVIDRDLSNFTWAKWTLSPNMAAGTLRILYADVYDRTIAAATNLVGSSPPIQNYPCALTFHAGKRVWLVYQVDDLSNFTVLDWLEAW